MHSSRTAITVCGMSMANRLFTCGARLRPGALPLLTRFPASDFTDRSVPIAEVFGARGGSFIDQPGEAASVSHGVDVMADFLIRQFAAMTMSLGFRECTTIKSGSFRSARRVPQDIACSPEAGCRALAQAFSSRRAHSSRASHFSKGFCIVGADCCVHRVRGSGSYDSGVRGSSRGITLRLAQPCSFADLFNTASPAAKLKCCQTQLPDKQGGPNATRR